MFKVNNKNTRTRFEVCSKLTIETPARCQWRHPGVFIVNFEHISHLVLVLAGIVNHSVKRIFLRKDFTAFSRQPNLPKASS